MSEQEASSRERALGARTNPLEQLDRLFRLTSRRTWIAVVALGLLVASLVVWGVVAKRDVTVSAPGMLVPHTGFVEVGRIEQGTVDEVRVHQGDTVHQGDVMASYIGPGGPARLVAPVDGVVEEVAVAQGATLLPGVPAFTLLPTAATTVAVAFASPAVLPQIRDGYQVSVQTASAPAAQYGSIVGYITDISNLPTALAEIDRLTGGDVEVAKTFLARGPVYEVQIRLDRDAKTFTGYRWTNSNGPNFTVPAGTLATMTARVGRSSIASELLK